MTLVDDIYIVIFILLFVFAFALLAFGQISMRKFRKNPEVAPFLGMSLMSGWDIMNASWALAIPEKILKILKHDKGDFANADYIVLRQHATKLDSILACLFFYSHISMVFLLVLCVVLERNGF